MSVERIQVITSLRPFKQVEQVLASDYDTLTAQHATVIASWKREELAWEAERATLATRVDTLRQHILHYGTHTPECSFHREYCPCSCGFEALRVEITGERS